MTDLDRIAFGVTTFGLLLLLAALVVGVLTVLPAGLALTVHSFFPTNHAGMPCQPNKLPLQHIES
jgi:hypothetical protein